MLGSDFISLIEDRWRDYDGAVEKRTTSGLPTSDVVSALTRRLDVADPVVTFKLSADFQQQMELITKTSIEIGLLKV